MPLRLKSLELHGYKTFAARTDFEFAEGITAIVGPNGSGKSNIADALRWVLGEQSYSLLRAKKTEDMIFAGSEQRPRAGMSSAVVTFDNTTGWLPVDFTEVGLTRRAYRDGRNEYLLNNQHVRLKDINELLAQSGLSERTYTILGQGLVDASLALRADDRRRLFEEAAGIGLYRSRREEALKRLETTQRNLDRVLDILAELGPRLKSLERQATRAQEYAQIKADLRLLLLEWYGFHWHRAQKDLAETMESARSHELKLSEAQTTYQRNREGFAAFRDQLNGIRGRLNSWHRQSAQLHESRESVSGKLATLVERQRALLENRQSILHEQARLADDYKMATMRLSESDVDFTNSQKEFIAAEDQLKTIQSMLDDRQAKRILIEKELETLRATQTKLSGQRATYQVQLEESKNRLLAQQKKLESIELEVIAGKDVARCTDLEWKSTIEKRNNANALVESAEKNMALARENQDRVENVIKKKESEQISLEGKVARVRAQIDILDQAEQALIGYGDGAKQLLEASRHSKLSGVKGALSSVVDVPPELEVAISAALGEYADAVLLNRGEDAESALSLLENGEPGRASLLPIDWLSPGDPLVIQPDENILGVASRLIRVPAELKPAAELLLGNTIIVRNRKTSRGILASLPKNARIVTLGGEVFHATGQITAGKQTNAGILGRSRQKTDLSGQLDSIHGNIETVISDLKIISNQLEVSRNQVSTCQADLVHSRKGFDAALQAERGAQEKVDHARRDLEWLINQVSSIQGEITTAVREQAEYKTSLSANDETIAQLQVSLREKSNTLAELNLDDLQNQVAFWGVKKAVAERALNDFQARISEKKLDLILLQESTTAAENHLHDIDRTMADLQIERESIRKEVDKVNDELEHLRVLIDPAEKELGTIEAKEVEFQQKEIDGQMAVARVERVHNQIQLDLGRKQESLQNLRQKIEDDFGLVAFEYASDISGPVPLPLDGMVEQLPIVVDLKPDLEENLIRQRAQLRRMGAVNPEARQEYEAVKERHTFLTTQVEDMHKAEADLREVISELDDLTRREFQKTFDAVAEEFHTIFHRLFGGGSARLTLTDPENLTETGIDIEARLPGRREQGLSLLSGGERSLTAIALVFSLLKVSPTPVCVMDEVDAMLDEANVGRFRDLLLELSKETQFIIITHNRNTVQAADVIYGVTMGRDSASQIISLKLDEISEDYLK